MATFIFFASAIVLAALQVGDVITTQRFIDNGKGVEINPIMRWCFARLPESLWWLPNLYTLPIMLACWLFWWPWGFVVIWLYCGWYAYLVYNNWLVGSGKPGLL